MSDSAQEKWGKAQAQGWDERTYTTLYPIATQQKKKAEVIEDLMAAGINENWANKFYGLVKGK